MRLTILISLAFLGVATAQSPTPIIVQAANGVAPSVANTNATSTSPKTAVAPIDDQSVPAAIKELEQIKAANDEVLAKQKAALEKLDQLQDAADQLRIFAKRG